MLPGVEGSGNAQLAKAQAEQTESVQQNPLSIPNEMIGELIENPLLKKEALDRTKEKLDKGLDTIMAVLSIDLDMVENTEDHKIIENTLRHGNGLVKTAWTSMEATNKSIDGSDISSIESEKLIADMALALANISDEEKDDYLKQIAPGPSSASGVVSDLSIAANLNNFLDNLTTVYLERYQQASSVSTDIYSAFAALNITISEMISRATVDAEKNTIELDLTGLWAAIEKLDATLFAAGTDPNSPTIADRLKAITFPAEMKAMAEELIEGTGLLLAGGPPPGDNPYHLVADGSPLQSLRIALTALADPKNVLHDNVIKVPSGALQAFQTSVESVNNKVSSNNQTMIERLRSVTNQQQQTTQLFSSVVKELFETNKGFISKIS